MDRVLAANGRQVDGQRRTRDFSIFFFLANCPLVFLRFPLHFTSHHVKSHNVDP